MSDTKQNGPNGFIIVLPGEVIEIPLESNKSWLTLFYSLPRELVEKRPAYLELSRCPYKVLHTDDYHDLIDSDAFLELVWDCFAWSAWQYIEVPRKDGTYGEIPGSPSVFSGDFPLWRLSYAMLPLLRAKYEVCGFSFQSLYQIPDGMEVPWLTYQQFSNLIGGLVPEIIKEQNWQPMIDATWQNRTVEDFDRRSSRAKSDFMRTWSHTRTNAGVPLSLEELTEDADENGASCEIPDPKADFESSVLSELLLSEFTATLSEKDREILRLKMEGRTLAEIARVTGYKNHSGVQKRVKAIADRYDNFIEKQYAAYLDSL